MPQAEEKKEEYLYRADPFTFVFRELDLIHGEIREIKAELGLINKRLDSMNESVNKRFDSMNESINKRFDSMNESVNKRFESMNESVNKRFDSMNESINKRFESMNESINKRFDDVNKRIDRLYLIVILNLMGIVAFLIKTFFF
ncbi:MAG: hypothetical protein ACK4TF_01145 [Thermodesulfovibrionales bacterium]